MGEYAPIGYWSIWTRSMDEGWQSDAAMLRRSDSQAPGVPCAGVGRGLCGHQRRWAGAWGDGDGA
jgi:hypothetical protein